MIGEENEKHLLFIKMFVVSITYIIIGVCLLLFIGVSKVNAAETLNTWRNSSQRQNCSNCTSLNFSNISGISTTNYFYTNQGTNVNWTFEHKITLKKSVNNTDVINLQSPTIRLYDGNSGYYDLTANNHCQGVYWRMSASTINLEDIKVYEVSFSCDISNFKTSFPSVNLFQIIYDVQQTGHNNDGTIQEVSFRTTETPYTTQNDYTGTINSVGGNIINNQNQNTTTITNNDNRNTQAIIDNQNANSQATIDAIEKQNLKCETYNNTYNYNNRNDNLNVGYIFYTNDIRPDANWRYTNYIAIDKGHTYILNGNALVNSNASYCIYNKDKTLISCQNYNSSNNTYTISNTDGFIRFSMYLNSANYSATFNGEYCYNLLEKQNEEQKAQNDYLMDNTPADYNIINDIQITSDTPISSLLTIPIRLIQAFLGNINGSCADYSFGSLYGTELKLKCGDIRYIPTLLGNAYTIIDYLMCFFMIYNIFQLLVQAWNTITSLKDDFSNIYETKTYSNGEGFDY